MSESKKEPCVFVQNLSILTQPENFQKYILGVKSSGHPRAVYDVIRDCTGVGKKKKKKGKKKKGDVPTTSIAFYTGYKAKKGKKKKKAGKHWRIDGGY